MIEVKVPATTANLGSGFDSLGLALDLLLVVRAELGDGEGKVCFKGRGALEMEKDPASNLVIRAMQEVFRKAGEIMPPVDVYIENNIPLGKGLGSSAAAIVAGLYTANALLKDRLDEKELMKMAVAMEGHADNVVPAMVGGLTAVMLEEGEVYYQKLPFPHKLKVIVAVPDFTLPTPKARRVLPSRIDLEEVIGSLQRACFLLASFSTGDFRFLDKAMNDKVFQEARKKFIPGFDEVVREAKKNGALGVALSGAGPSLIALADRDEYLIGEKIKEVWGLHGVNSDVFYLKVHERGVTCMNF
ncbi:homoserine kinase [Thermosyntropha lipolytica DSM 11003]|uniref:Homoserine kinase n=1 Tax=Thermosyntropha lipolytica DSM 11003 TaxID=1123382 RepID=A0A1M5M1F7_9FIRM|nr:homoserine kinase [Thermosyntropha lipolytica]SHG71172.1 homoserine kinase [Thermosyntropha lipolytica DSM 11003]